MITSTNFSRQNTLYDSDQTGFVGGLNSNSALSGGKIQELSVLQNFNISDSGYLMPREGLIEKDDISTWLDFDYIVEYIPTYGNFAYKDVANSIYVKKTLASNITSPSNIYLQDSMNDYDFIEYIVEGFSFTVSDYSGTYQYGLPNNPLITLEHSNDNNDYVRITGLKGKLTSIVGYNYTSKEQLSSQYTGYSKSEFVIYVRDGLTYLSSRYSQESGGVWELNEPSQELVLSNSAFTSKDYHYEKDNRLILNYDGAILVSDLTINGTNFENVFYDITDGNEYFSQPLDINSINLHGFNLLNPAGDLEISDKQGVVINIDGIQTTGIDTDNKQHPFRTGRKIKLNAITTYTNTNPLDKLNYRWSYDYLGNDYLNSNLISNLKNNEGETLVQQTFKTENKTLEFSPSKSGVYRFYVVMARDDQLDSKGQLLQEIKDVDGNITQEKAFIPTTQRGMIDLEFTSQASTQPDSLIMYQSLKKSKVIRRWGAYFVYIGAEDTSFSDTLFFSLPNNPTYVPETFYVELPNEVIKDVLVYREQLIIFTESNTYRLEGDAPSSLVYSQNITNSMTPFSVKNIMNGVGLKDNKSLVAAEEIFIHATDGIRKVFYTSGNILKSKLISQKVQNILPETFDEFYAIDKYIYFVSGEHTLVYEPLTYNELTGDGRYLYYKYEEKVANIYKDVKKYVLINEKGLIGEYDNVNLGIDFGKKQRLKFKTQPNFLGNKNINKRFISFLTTVVPYKLDGTEGLGSIAVDVYIDGKHNVSSENQRLEFVGEYDEYGILLGGEYNYVNEKTPNFEVHTRGFTLTQKDKYDDYGERLKDGLFFEESHIYDGTSDVDYIQEMLLNKGRGRAIQIEMEFENPYIIKAVDFKYKNTKAKANSRTRDRGRKNEL